MAGSQVGAVLAWQGGATGPITNRWERSSAAVGSGVGGVAGVAGSAPGWGLGSKGRAHVDRPHSELANVGLPAWFGDAQGEAAAYRGGKNVAKAAQEKSGSLQEPALILQRKLDPYLYRRTEAQIVGNPPLDPPEYRRHLRAINYVPPPPRPAGRRVVVPPEPKPQPLRGIRKVDVPEPETSTRDSIPLPPRRAKVPGQGITKESGPEMERSLGDEMFHRHRIDLKDFYGKGYAGDKTGTLGAPIPVELAQGTFRKEVDPPTFTRFMSTLAPPPEISCHERRRRHYERKVLDEKQDDQMKVAELDKWDAAVHKDDDVPAD
ncbi:unnamed protein product [Pedinophyceae sp. YPF-701]|nr:unnamed protein product [Pedinophyceae sp. YPF-701]